MTRIARLLCRLGLHAFRPWAWNSVVEPMPVEKCARCGRGRKLLMCGAVLHYSLAQMEQAAEDLERAERGESHDR